MVLGQRQGSFARRVQAGCTSGAVRVQAARLLGFGVVPISRSGRALGGLGANAPGPPGARAQGSRGGSGGRGPPVACALRRQVGTMRPPPTGSRIAGGFFARDPRWIVPTGRRGGSDRITCAAERAAARIVRAPVARAGARHLRTCGCASMAQPSRRECFGPHCAALPESCTAALRLECLGEGAHVADCLGGLLARGNRPGASDGRLGEGRARCEDGGLDRRNAAMCARSARAERSPACVPWLIARGVRW